MKSLKTTIGVTNLPEKDQKHINIYSRTIRACVVSVLCVVFFSLEAANSEFIVTNSNLSAISILFQADDAIVAPLALAEQQTDLAELIKKSTGLALAKSIKEPTQGRFIYLEIGCDIAKDGFIYSSPSEREVVICAADMHGLSYAITDFAERYLGVRWLFPAANGLGTYVPKNTKLIVSREEVRYVPAYSNRQFSFGRVSSDYKPWARRMRTLSSKAAFHHNLLNLFPPQRYRVTHSRFYPMDDDGVRYPKKNDLQSHNWQPVLGAKDLFGEGVANIRSYFDENPSLHWYSLGMNDSIRWGTEQMRGRHINSLGFIHMSDDYFPWVSDMASEVLKTHPKRTFGVLAYHNLVDAPLEPINAHVVPFITYDRMQWVDPLRRFIDQERTQKWAKKSNELGWYDYVYGDQVHSSTGKPFYAAPRIYPHLMAEYLRFGYEMGVRHYYAESYASTDDWREGPKLYVLAKLLWDPDLDVDALLDDWYLSAVGPGAAALRAYFDFWEEFWTQRVPETLWFQRNRGDYLHFTRDGYLEALTVEDRSLLVQYMNKLISVTRDSPYQARADFFFKSWQKVDAQAMGARFDFQEGKVAKGFTTLLKDSVEGDNGSTPDGWSFWSRPNVGATLYASELTDAYAANGMASMNLRVAASGEGEIHALFYRAVPIEQDKHYCAKVDVHSPTSNFVMSISFRSDVSASKYAHKTERLYRPTGRYFDTKVLCVELPKDTGPKEITLWLGVLGKRGSYNAWFDNVEIFVSP